MTETKFFGFIGGMDMVTPSIMIPPGRVRSCRNHESSPRGYRRVDGWEYYDGRAKPSTAEFKVITFENGSDLPEAGAIITGASSGSTATVLYNSSIYSGNVIAGTAVGAFPIINDTGLLHGEIFRIAGNDIGVITSTPGPAGIASLEEEEAWTLAAMDYLRSFIQPVPGSGPVRGVAVFEGDVYAFRDNVGATQGAMYKATAAGWVLVSMQRTLTFDAGTSDFTVGEVVTGSTSGATATIKKVILQDGDWTTNDGVGRLIITPISGTFVDNEIILSTSAGSATVNGVSTAITLPPGGRYHFDINNFLVTTGTICLYGANGVGTAFEFDGETLTPIVTGEPNDAPIRIAAHSDHLFLAYEDGRFIHSAIFKPMNYEIILGALAGGIGEPISDLVPTATGELAIFGRNKVAVLYGTNASNWDLKVLTNESGSVPWTAQLIGMPLYLDHIGVRSLDATQSYGNFSLGTKTQLIQPFISAKASGEIAAVGSLRIRAKDMYRLFFADGSGVSIYFGRKQPECMIFQINFTPTCFISGEDINGREILFAGSSTGHVYQMDAGVSANGERILAFMRLPFNHVGSPTNDKRWHRAAFEMNASSKTNLSITYSCSYGSNDLPQASEQDFIVFGGGGIWNESLWNQFKWSSPLETIAGIHIDGIGQNISLTIISDNLYDEPYTIHGVTLNFNYRRLVR